MEIPTGYHFEFVAGRLALDFANTTSGFRGSEETHRERLPAYDELLRWAGQRGVVSDEQARRLQAGATRDAAAAADVHARAIRLREALFRLFKAASDHRRAAREDLEVLNAELSRALQHQRLVERDGALQLEWDTAFALDAMLWPVVRDGAELLASEKLARVKVCEARHEGRCDWLFLDETKSNTRRWCSMKDCGNQAKQRRHQQRIRKLAD